MSDTPRMTRALVLGGGGVTGVAWELGILRGLEEQGIAVTDADEVIGTSAGSVVAAKVTSGAPLQGLYEEQLAPSSTEKAARLGGLTLLRYGWAMMSSSTLPELGRKLGALALKASTVSEASRRAVIEARLPKHEWPVSPRLRITAVDAASGEFRVFDKESGVSLVDAVGASCAVPGVWPPVTIGAARFIDGGMRSATNADLAQGAKAVVIIAPLHAGLGIVPALRDQVQALRAGGAKVACVTPNPSALAAIGNNVLDPSRAAGSARAGLAQAAEVAAEIRATWAT